jgi:lycopene cyclase domain-containing protein
MITGVIFILWDMYFTSLGIWGFNSQYLVGVEIGNLPLEEILFFFCIPYACVFTYHCLDIFFANFLTGALEKYVTLLLIILLLVFGVIFYDKLYTVTTFLSFAVVLVFAKWILKVNWLGKFYLIYAVLLIPFFIVNGVLTGTGLEEPVVWYNENQFMGYRIGTIPVEDTFYGMELILINLLIYKYILSRRKIFA